MSYSVIDGLAIIIQHILQIGSETALCTRGDTRQYSHPGVSLSAYQAHSVHARATTCL